MNKKEKIKNFVQKKLGCKCPEEVFEFIDLKQNFKLDNDILLNARLNIGNRLLIYVLELNSPHLLKNNFAAIIAQGKRERDSKKFNRFRLVLIAEEEKDIAKSAIPLFNSLIKKDEKMHLHVLKKHEKWIV